jgi:prepilin-type N-terminal cleavage/methylation domain-containing protein
VQEVFVFCPPPKGWLGFTLSELLVAVAILGLIATFTIPKVLQGIEAIQRKAIFKEDYAALSQLSLKYYQEGRSDRLDDYLIANLNAQKVCNNDASSEGCRNTTTTPYDWVSGWKGVLMHNGSVITMVPCTAYACGTKGAQITIDWNGDKLPNHGHSGIISNDDIITLYVYAAEDSSINALQDGFYYQPGKIYPWQSSGNYKAIFADIMK